MRVANISLSTKDLPANRPFYAEALGVPVRGEHEGILSLSLADPDGRMVEVMSTAAWDRAAAANSKVG